MKYQFLIPFFLASVSLAGCWSVQDIDVVNPDEGASDSDTDTDTDTDADADTDSDTDSDTDTDTDVNGCDYAIPMDTAATFVQGMLEQIDDINHYSITLAAGDFVQIFTDIHNGDGTLSLLDPVITLWNADGTALLATADDQIPRLDMDSELIYHAPTAGTYCVAIEGWEHWSGQTAGLTTNWHYAMAALLMDPSQIGWSSDFLHPEAETNDTIADANDMTSMAVGSSNTTYGRAYGDLSGATDVDVFTYTLPTEAVATSIGFYKPFGAGSSGGGGVQGHGSTLTDGMFTLTDMSGNVISTLDVSFDGADWVTPNNPPDANVPMAGGTQVAVHFEGGTGWTPGANDFYVLEIINQTSDNTGEVETNDTAGTASTTTFAANTSGGESGFVMGAIDPAGTDVDYWEFDALAGEEIALACGAASNGSGLVDATFAIHNASDTLIQEETESGYDSILWSSATGASMPPISVSANATYYLVISAASQSAAMTANHYRCAIHRGIP